MAKLSKSMFSGDKGPDYDGSDGAAQHLFHDDIVDAGEWRQPGVFDKLVAISKRAAGDPLPVLEPKSEPDAS